MGWWCTELQYQTSSGYRTSSKEAIQFSAFYYNSWGS
ncbi:hypothetical protein CR513_20981 [Mucuna pruriens]|uniref:Uncharacterized protein n=1 Tax=Mucuna pruriens TaxID=157652 RepID=A0A371H0R0_MUCPR|nr:hypothetical protein CR513_20981 [Mucuna pruriens]